MKVHFAKAEEDWTLCGRKLADVSYGHMSKVTCERCKKTKAYRELHPGGTYTFDNPLLLKSGGSMEDLLKQFCKNCHHQINTMCFMGTDPCSENCRKDLENAA